MKKKQAENELSKAIASLESHLAATDGQPHSIRSFGGDTHTCSVDYAATEKGKLYLETWVLPRLETVMALLSEG